MVILKKGRDLILFILGATAAHSIAHSSMPEYTLPVITSDIKIAADIGYNIIEKGGNAVDGAVATALAVGAINAFASGLGGGGFLLLMKNEKCTEYNFREMAPKSATENKYKEQEDSFRGRRAIAIPSELYGLYSVHSDHGMLPWKDLFTDLIDLLENGFRVSYVLSSKLKKFEEIIKKDKGLRETYVRNGKVVEKGDIITRKNLASTLRTLSVDPGSFYKGSIADSLLAFINNGQTYIEKEELKSVKVTKKTVGPVKIDEEIEVYTTTLPTTGYMLRIAMAVICEMKKMKLNLSEQTLQKHLITIYNELFHIRSKLEDTKDEELNIESLQMLAPQDKTATRILENIKENRPFIPYMNELAEDYGTTHINVVDKEGAMVSLTSTINQNWGCGLMDPVTGIILNNQIDDFTFENFSNGSSLRSTPGYPHKNKVSPHRQPLSSAMPSFIRIGKEFLVLGSSGGIRIPTAVISTISRIFLSNMSIEEAINHPRLHYQGSNILKIEDKYTSILPDIGVPWKVLRDETGIISTCVHIIKYNILRKTAHAVADIRKHAGVAGTPVETPRIHQHTGENIPHKNLVNVSFSFFTVKDLMNSIKK